jgi:hypothetical protein
MNIQKMQLIEEQTSPLFRIMSVYDDSDVVKRKFDANIIAFHVGKGLILSVGHYMPLKLPLLWSIPEQYFQSKILPSFSHGDRNFIIQHFLLDNNSQKRYLNAPNDRITQILIKKFKDNQIDTQIQSLYAQGICKPFIIIQFKNDKFFNSPAATAKINPDHVFYEKHLNRYTFILELDIVHVFLKHDIAIYRVCNRDSDVVNAIPGVIPDFSNYEDGITDLYCLQNSPSNTNLGRLLNRAKIEGVLDHWADMNGYINEGFRYLIQGYFRFGSSGAPYVRYDNDKKIFSAIAIQSEACPIQLTIKNDREGNFQYINAIASPISHITKELKQLMVI